MFHLAILYKLELLCSRGSVYSPCFMLCVSSILFGSSSYLALSCIGWLKSFGLSPIGAYYLAALMLLWLCPYVDWIYGLCHIGYVIKIFSFGSLL